MELARPRNLTKGLFSYMGVVVRLGPSNPTVSALYAIEPWCASNSSKKFSDGLLNLAAKLRTAIKR
jgi:hypothetical protein